MTDRPPARIQTLDLIRGAAVLGILTVNIASFAAGEGALHSPDVPHPGTGADHFVFAATLVLFEGKMRALFSMLFGASLLLFIERAEAAGRDGAVLQLRRLGWLLAFGYLHFALLWDGDILFIYAAIGLIALGFRHAGITQKLIGAVLALALWQAWSSVMWAPVLAQESAVLAGTASAAEREEHSLVLTQYRQQEAARANEVKSGWTGEVTTRLADRPAYPLTLAFYNWGETLAYMLLGMALLQSGFFSGGVSRKWLRRIIAGGLVLGGGASIALAAWAAQAGYPEMAMRYWAGYGLAFPHALMALSYAAALVMLAPWLLAGRTGQSLEAAGRMAFSNYIATSLVMTGLFHGWGLGLYGRYDAAAQFGFVLLGWALMLGWSKPWLARFRQGPLEWIWRSLTEWRVQPFTVR